VPDDGVFGHVERVYLPKWKSILNCLLCLPTNTPLQVAYYKSSLFKRCLDDLIPSHDLAFAHLLRSGDYLKHIDVPKVLEMTDAISMNYEGVRKLKNKWGVRQIIFAIEQSRLNKYERSIAKHFDFSILISEIDRQYLYSEEDYILSKVIVSSNGVDVNALPYNYKPESKSLVFIGNMTSLQNFDAARWFAAEILPLLLDFDDFEFKVVGRITEDKKAELEKYAGVIVTGAVESIPDSVRGALAGICSMRIGAGVQNKILEYMSLGLPVISSPLGHEGISAEEGKEILIANTPNDYIKHIKCLCDKDGFGQELSILGRKFVEENHDWSAMLTPVIKRIEKLLNYPK
jgi:glycosyltransferase involved in cell wall biosynthesis